jgi:pyruvate dehydrogenase E1 component
MLIEQEDVFYYITLMNESYAQPDLPVGANEGVIKGGYLLNHFPSAQSKSSVTLLGSGAILTEVVKAAKQLANQGISCTVYSITSWSELARDGQACETAALEKTADLVPYFTKILKDSSGPIIAATDYVRSVPESVRAFIPEGRSFMTLGTDGFGRSDTRAALREFFAVNAEAIEKTAKFKLALQETK